MKYEIFGSNSCPYCQKAKELLTKLGLEFEYKNIDEDEEAFDQLVGRIKRWKTVPQIFYGSTHIGGFTELEEYVKSIHTLSWQNASITTLSSARPEITLNASGGTWAFKIKNDGALVFNPELTVDQQIEKTTAAIVSLWDQTRGPERLGELMEANSRYLNRARAGEQLLKQVVTVLHPNSELAKQISDHLAIYYVKT